jgi:hypothetical protein
VPHLVHCILHGKKGPHARVRTYKRIRAGSLTHSLTLSLSLSLSIRLRRCCELRAGPTLLFLYFFTLSVSVFLNGLYIFHVWLASCTVFCVSLSSFVFLMNSLERSAFFLTRTRHFIPRQLRAIFAAATGARLGTLLLFSESFVSECFLFTFRMYSRFTIVKYICQFDRQSL